MKKYKVIIKCPNDKVFVSIWETDKSEVSGIAEEIRAIYEKALIQAGATEAVTYINVNNTQVLSIDLIKE